jgi:hypothetical protein
MARIEWIQLCETAFLDNCDRLCMVGVTNRFPVPTLPIAVHQLMIAARVVDVRPGEGIDVGVSIATPSGLCPSPDDPHCIEIANAGEYVLITLRQFPLAEEGMYHFAISLGSGDPATLDIPVLLASTSTPFQIH